MERSAIRVSRTQHNSPGFRFASSGLRLFNSSLEGNTRRAIDVHEGDKIDEKALKALIRAAVALNTLVRATARPARSQKRPKSA
jgi:hypothetical protein